MLPGAKTEVYDPPTNEEKNFDDVQTELTGFQRGQPDAAWDTGADVVTQQNEESPKFTTFTIGCIIITAVLFFIVGYTVHGSPPPVHGRFPPNGPYGASCALGGTFEEKMAAVLPKIARAQARKWNTGVQIGIKHAAGFYSTAAGLSHPAEEREMNTSTPIAMGSLTKTWTAAAMMQHVSTGAVDINAPFVPYVDGYLVEELGNTTVGLFGEWIENVTIRMLLQMRSGLADYPDDVLREWTVAGIDYGPFDVINVSSKEPLFEVDQGAAYSSVSYVFLGLVLANISGAPTYQDYDQKSVLPPGIRERFPNTIFPTSGLCKDYDTASMFAYDAPAAQMPRECQQPGSLQQIDASYLYGSVLNYSCGLTYGTVDARDFSCTNGWTMGNIITTAGEAADFMYELYGPAPTIVPATAQAQMLNFSYFTQGWGVGMPYGYGTYVKSVPTAPASTTGWMYGHGGADYGSYTNAHYNPILRFSLVVATTNESSLAYDSTLKAFWPGQPLSHYTSSISNAHAEDTWCAVLNGVLEALSEFEGSIPGVDSTTALPKLSGWFDKLLGRVTNNCYFCRLCEGMPQHKSAAGPSGSAKSRRRSRMDDEDDD